MEQEQGQKAPNQIPKILILMAAAGLIIGSTLAWNAQRRAERPNPNTTVHNDITTTVFWAGEGADSSNGYIHNRSSTWVGDWVAAYGGVDDPENRCNMLPCDFTPKENPFYFALPYNDLDESCRTKPSQAEVPWFDDSRANDDSIIKNRWIKVQFAGKVAYAQWADAGPYGEDDANYVFGGVAPQSKAAGLDISPATAEYLGIDGRGQTSWEFIAVNDVPDGPWRQTITTSPPDCTK